METPLRKMKCRRCGNTDPDWFYHGKKGWYCRKCIAFGRALIEEDLEASKCVPIKEEAYEYTLRFPLTKAQKEISEAAAYAVKHVDVLLECVCGAGKTEMVIKAISDALKEGKRACFSIPRRQVVLEVAERLAGYFKHAQVRAVCGGHTDNLEGDLIVCTAHQLYRFCAPGKKFDLLIIDEGDAFPFSELLHNIAKNTCTGHIIYLTATPDEELLKRVEKKSILRLNLNERPHHHPLPVPVIHTAPAGILLVLLVGWVKTYRHKPRIVFVPTIRSARYMRIFLSLFEKCYACTSKTENRDEVIEAYRHEPHGLIVATTVLERGVTIPHAQVCVFMANNGVFNEAGLVQMAGRAGRSFDDPGGNVTFLYNEKSVLAEKCRDTLREANRAVFNVRM